VLGALLSPEQLERWPRTHTGLLSVSEAALKYLDDVPAAASLLAIRAKQRLLQNFGAKLVEYISPVTGRIHCDFLIAAAKQGRFSCRHPNLQQLPGAKAPAFKRCIVARLRHLLVGCDWNQIELRALAWIAGCPDLTRVYAEGRDLHKETGAQFAGVPVEDVSAEQRQYAKPCNYGAVYGIQAPTLVVNAFVDYGIRMSVADAQRVLDRFFAMFPGVDRWRWEHYRRCKRQGYVEIGAGRIVRREWEAPNAWGERKLRFTQCCNLPISGICADAMLRAIVLVHSRLKQARVRGGLIATIHDELLLEVLEDDAEKARGILEEAMLDAFTETLPGAPTVKLMKAKIGKTWEEAKKED
jgi:DNA polymerase-1